jgi:uncharacterized membrane protein HdeD (DUF308 family)
VVAMEGRDDDEPKRTAPYVRPWVFKIWLVVLMTIGAMIGHSFAFNTFGHPKAQPVSVMYWFASLIGLGGLFGAVVAYATKSGTGSWAWFKPMRRH